MSNKKAFILTMVIAIIVLALTMLTVQGCDAIEQTPEGPRLTPEAVAKIDRGADTAEEVGEAATALGFVFPPLFAVGGLVGGVVGAWRKFKPKMDTLKTNAELAGTVTHDIVVAVEKFKQDFPEEWDKALKPTLSANLDKSVKSEISRIKEK